jgi:hypothetical protein
MLTYCPFTQLVMNTRAYTSILDMLSEEIVELDLSVRSSCLARRSSWGKASKLTVALRTVARTDQVS